METWWRATTYCDPEPIEVKSTSALFVTTANGRRQAKDGEWSWIRPTRKEAIGCVVAYHERCVARSARELNEARAHLREAVDLLKRER